MSYTIFFAKKSFFFDIEKEELISGGLWMVYEKFWTYQLGQTKSELIIFGGKFKLSPIDLSLNSLLIPKDQSYV